MQRPALVRIAPALFLAGGLLGALGDAYHLVWDLGDLGERSALLASPAYRAHGILIGAGYGLLLAGLAALLVAGGARWSSLGTVGAVLAFVGTPFVVGDYWAESVVTPAVVASAPALADADATGAHLAAVVAAFAVFALGWALVGIALGRSGLAHRGHAAAVAVGAAVAFTPFAGSNLLLFLALGAFGVARKPFNDATTLAAP